MSTIQTTGSQMVVDKATGFLSAQTFTAEKKTKLLELATDCVKTKNTWPDYGELCDIIGIHPITLRRHLQMDEKFAEAMDAVTERGKFKLETAMYRLHDKNPAYMFGWLNKWRPNEYTNDRRVIIQHAPQIVGGHASAIDAELVPTAELSTGSVEEKSGTSHGVDDE